MACIYICDRCHKWAPGRPSSVWGWNNPKGWYQRHDRNQADRTVKWLYDACSQTCDLGVRDELKRIREETTEQMSHNKTKWKCLAARLRKALGLAPPTLEEADAEMAKAEEVPMSDEDIERIVSGATKKDRTPSGGGCDTTKHGTPPSSEF